jgi:hypothetical protein
MTIEKWHDYQDHIIVTPNKPDAKTVLALRALIALGPWCRTEVLKPYADAWDADLAAAAQRHDDGMGELSNALAALQARVEALERELRKERKRGRIRARLIEVYYRVAHYFVGRYHNIYDGRHHDKTPAGEKMP